MFDIYLNSAVVGSADVKRKGLYYYINCSCKPPSNEIHRVIMCDTSYRKDLGICVPLGNVFTLSAHIPIKYFQGDEFTFELVRESKEEYVITNDMHFAHLDKLETARLYVANGQSRLIID